MECLEAWFCFRSHSAILVILNKQSIKLECNMQTKLWKKKGMWNTTATSLCSVNSEISKYLLINVYWTNIISCCVLVRLTLHFSKFSDQMKGLLPSGRWTMILSEEVAKWYQETYTDSNVAIETACKENMWRKEPGWVCLAEGWAVLNYPLKKIIKKSINIYAWAGCLSKVCMWETEVCTQSLKMIMGKREEMQDMSRGWSVL